MRPVMDTRIINSFNLVLKIYIEQLQICKNFRRKQVSCKTKLINLGLLLKK